MTEQLDLFTPPVVPGLTHRDGLISAIEERALIEHVDAAGLAPFQFHQWQGKRLTASFGRHYDFGERGLGVAPEMPEWLLPLRARAAEFAGLGSDALVHALVIRYDPGAGIGWHKDKAVFGHVIGISLGSPTTLRLRQRTPTGFRRARLPLAPRSVYQLTGAARHEWEHGIAPMTERRWSITFRTLA